MLTTGWERDQLLNPTAHLIARAAAAEPDRSDFDMPVGELTAVAGDLKVEFSHNNETDDCSSPIVLISKKKNTFGKIKTATFDLAPEEVDGEVYVGETAHTPSTKHLIQTDPTWVHLNKLSKDLNSSGNKIRLPIIHPGKVLKVHAENDDTGKTAQSMEQLYVAE